MSDTVRDVAEMPAKAVESAVEFAAEVSQDVAREVVGWFDGLPQLYPFEDQTKK
jgi:hypothetical protein